MEDDDERRENKSRRTARIREKMWGKGEGQWQREKESEGHGEEGKRGKS